MKREGNSTLLLPWSPVLCSEKGDALAKLTALEFRRHRRLEALCPWIRRWSIAPLSASQCFPGLSKARAKELFSLKLTHPRYHNSDKNSLDVEDCYIAILHGAPIAERSRDFLVNNYPIVGPFLVASDPKLSSKGASDLLR